MPLNKNALIRYRTIDKCLQNKYRQWTLEDLIEACSDALYEFEGKKVSISKRTVQLDIQTMRSEKLGFNAPIEVYDKKFYRYADEDFTITDIPLTETDMNVLTETVEMLKQFKDFSLYTKPVIVGFSYTKLFCEYGKLAFYRITLFIDNNQ